MAKGKRPRRRSSTGPVAIVPSEEVIEACLRKAADTIREVERDLERSFVLSPSAAALRILSKQ